MSIEDKSTKFFYFSQNNSGGYFDETLGTGVIIEAKTAKEANSKLESLGGYFDGCMQERDCNCCGDRWYRATDKQGVNYPSYYSDKHDPEGEIYLSFGLPIYIFYLNGDTVQFRKGK